jgi:hypothetical protein
VASVRPGGVDGAVPEGLVLLARLVRLSRQFPLLTVPAEVATVGPLLNLMIGGDRVPIATVPPFGWTPRSTSPCTGRHCASCCARSPDGSC